MNTDFYTLIDGRIICNACNVRPDYYGDHRCFRDDGGTMCQCPSGECRVQRGEITFEELLKEDEAW